MNKIYNAQNIGELLSTDVDILTLIDDSKPIFILDKFLYQIIFAAESKKSKDKGLSTTDLNLPIELKIIYNNPIEEKEVDYVRNRLVKTQNPYLKYVYSNLLLKLKKGYEYAEIAIKSIIELFDLFYLLPEMENELRFLAKYINLGLDICLSFNKTDYKFQLIEKIGILIDISISKRIFNACHELTEIFKAHWKLKEFLPWEKFESLLLLETDCYGSEILLSFSGANQAYTNLIWIYSKQNNKDKINHLYDKKVARLEKDIKNPELSNMLRVKIVDEIIRIYHELKNEEKEAYFIDQKRVLSKKVIENEMKMFSQEMRIDEKNIREEFKILEHIKPFERFIMINRMLKMLDLNRKESDILDLIGKVVFDADGRTMNTHEGFDKEMEISFVLGHFQLILKIFFTESELRDGIIFYISQIYPSR